MSFKHFYDTLINQNTDNFIALYDASESFQPKNTQQVVKLIEFLNLNDFRKVDACLTALRNSSCEQRKILKAVEPLLYHDETLVVEKALQTFAAMSEFAEEYVQVIVKRIQDIMELAKTNITYPPLVKAGFQILTQKNFDSEICMNLAKSLDWQLPDEEKWDFDPFKVHYHALGVIATHASADLDFSSKTLVKAMNSAVNHNIRQAGFNGMIKLSQKHPEFEKIIIDSLRQMAIEAQGNLSFELEERLNTLFKSNFNSMFLFELMIDPSFPWSYFNLNQNDAMVKNLISNTKNFPELCSFLEKALNTAKDRESVKCAAILMGYVNQEQEKIANILTNKALKSENDDELLTTLLVSIEKLKRKSDKLDELIKMVDRLSCKDPLMLYARRRLGKKYGYEFTEPSEFFDAFRNPGSIHWLAQDKLILELISHNNNYWYLYQQITEPADQNKWETNAERFGAAKIIIDDNKVDLIDVPLDTYFPKQSTGSAGSKRNMKLEWLKEEKAIISINEPFCNNNEWGFRNYLYYFDMKNNCWLQITQDNLDGKVINPDTKPGKAENIVCHGTLICWPDSQQKIQWVGDTTPHIESAEVSDEVIQAFEQAKKYRPISKKYMTSSYTDNSVEIFDGPSNSAILRFNDLDLLVSKLANENVDMATCLGAIITTDNYLIITVVAHTDQDDSQTRYAIVSLKIT